MQSSLRRQARELALQVLFQREFLPSIDADAGLAVFKDNFKAHDDVWVYAHNLITGVITKITEIDQVIQSNSAHWSLNRMALTDLILLRIAVFELKYADPLIPPAVAMNEAIEISKKYGTTDSAAFVNGILDQIYRSRI